MEDRTPYYRHGWNLSRLRKILADVQRRAPRQLSAEDCDVLASWLNHATAAGDIGVIIDEFEPDDDVDLEPDEPPPGWVTAPDPADGYVMSDELESATRFEAWSDRMRGK